ncbi:uncharacterized protein ASPGLDRAFT_45531 [Aspergillus glaucus CBS 516.65]|uniref:DUF7600 domain-containing protein n=1 Tax=Aspergillus glaucus CBS 516.65 TaxID=1160497 RepID=A0A1L9VNT0_ASPGL|nr:hypothetical protein ASPGLDRAFT_45531 [Aspergillus glaucus CBS 516.65]OJJ85552.1 hypothetical protein ASPGLDRAFT_45531 [Aspergillus glaucus CBS 516.65]
MKSSLSNTLGVGREDLNVSDWNWKGVQARNLEYDEKFVEQTAFIPSSLSSISISFTKEIMGKNTNDCSPPTRQNKSARGDEYVTGIELISDTDDQPPIRLGHMIPGNRVTYQVKSFKAFEVAMNDKGIHALRIIFDADEPATLWIGNSSAASITNRLILKENVAALEACFTASCTYIP